MIDMRPEYPVIVLAVLLLLDGCGSRSGSTEASIPHGQALPPAERPLPPEAPSPAYDMPLEIHIDAPEPPGEIVGPSAPVPPDTPFPRGPIPDLFKGSWK